jgi:CHAD domain-containing protein
MSGQVPILLSRALQEYAICQTDAFSVNFIRCVESPRRSAIHDLRLSIKRLKALALLCKELSVNRRGSGRLSPVLEDLFILMGKYRDTQISSDIFTELAEELQTQFEQYGRSIRHAKEIQFDRVQKRIRQIRPGAPLRRILATVERVTGRFPEEKMLEEMVGGYLGGSWQKITSLSAERHTRTNLHEIRIRLKQFWSLYSVLQDAGFPAFTLPVDMKLLDEFQELIGQWHDMQVFNSRTARFYSKMKTHRKTRMKMYFLLGSIRKKQRRLHRRVLLQIPDLFVT